MKNIIIIIFIVSSLQGVAQNIIKVGSGNVTQSALNDTATAIRSSSGATANQAIGTIGLTVDGQGGIISTGSKGFVTIPYNCTITNWYVSADVSGAVQFDIKRSGTSIVGAGNKPVLSSSKSGNAFVSGWTSTAITAGDILEWNVDSGSTITICTVVLKVTK